MKKIVLCAAFFVLSVNAADVMDIQGQFEQAVKIGDHVAADELLKSGNADVNARISFFGSHNSEDFDSENSQDLHETEVPPLIVAADDLNIPLMNVLMHHGADLAAKDSKNNNVLHNLAMAVCVHKNKMPQISHCVKFFTQQGVDLNAKNDNNRTPLAEAALIPHNAECIDALMVSQNALKQDALSNAILSNDPENISTLLFHGTSLTPEHTDVLRDIISQEEAVSKKIKKCKSLVNKGTQSKYFVKHCFGKFKESLNDKRNVFQIVKGRQIGKKR